MSITVRPATSFADMRTMVGPKRPDANVCWCLSYRISSAQNRELVGPDRGDFVKGLCRQSPPPGVFAYNDDDQVVGWAAVAPRAATTFATNRKIPKVNVDGVPSIEAWSVWCLRVRPGHRKQGITGSLVAGAVDFARDQGAPALEAYPVDNGGDRVDLTMAYVGTRAMFERAGFSYAADTTSVLNGFPRILMRHPLS